jgi:hypothetical protein
MKIILAVTPAKAGVHFRSGTQWIPASAGMTRFSVGPQATRNLAVRLFSGRDSSLRSE